MDQLLQHQRHHEQLQEYWERLRGDRPYPRESEINPEMLGDVWASCFLISNDAMTKRVGYRYTYLGKDLIDAYGDDVSTPEVAENLIYPGSVSIIEAFDRVLQTKEVVVHYSEFENLKKMHIKYRTIVLPLGIGDEVTHIIGSMRWRAY